LAGLYPPRAQEANIGTGLWNAWSPATFSSRQRNYSMEFTMSPPQETLPEGTDAIIPGAGVEDAGDGFALTTDPRSIPKESGATSSTGGSTSSSTGGSTSNQAGSIKEDATRVIGDKAAGLRDQAADRARAFALQGKDRATDAIDNIVQMIEDAADTVDDKVGGHYGDYVRRASGTLADLADQLRDKDVDELVADARELVKGNPLRSASWWRGWPRSASRRPRLPPPAPPPRRRERREPAPTIFRR
jgi:hypothetical protein